MFLGWCFFCFFCILAPHMWHMEDPKLGVTYELQLLAYVIAIPTQELNFICDLYHSSQLNRVAQWGRPGVEEARDWTHILMDTSQVCYHWATRGTLKCNLCNSNNIYYFHKDIITLKKSNTNQNLFYFFFI